MLLFAFVCLAAQEYAVASPTLGENPLDVCSTHSSTRLSVSHLFCAARVPCC